MVIKNEQGVDGSSVIEKGAGIIERAWEAHWALRLMCFVFFLDTVMMLRQNSGLTQWSANDQALLGDVGWIALCVTAFSVAVAIVLPVIVGVIRWVVFGLYMLLPSTLSGDSRPYQRSLGMVSAQEFRILALEEKDPFLLQIYEHHENERRALEASKQKTGNLVAAVLIFALVDWSLFFWIPGSESLMMAVVRILGDSVSIVFGTIALCAGCILKLAWFPLWAPNEIYYPPLDRKIREKERVMDGHYPRK